MGFKKATKEKSKARIGLCGPAGSGKSYTSLRLAHGLGKKIAAIDTEHGSLSKYAGEFDFDVMELDNFHPQNYIQGIRDAEREGYDVLIIDSLTHAWNGVGGVVDIKEKAEARQRGGNSFTAWKEATPQHNALVEAILQSKIHIIATMRSKTEYIIEKNEKGQSVPRKVGMAPIQRDGMEYEFDIVGDLDVDNTLIVTKSRCKTLSGAVIKQPGEEMAQAISDWLSDGVEPVEKPKLEVVPPTTTEQQEPTPTVQEVVKAKYSLFKDGDMSNFESWVKKQQDKGKDWADMNFIITKFLKEKQGA